MVLKIMRSKVLCYEYITLYITQYEEEYDAITSAVQ